MPSPSPTPAAGNSYSTMPFHRRRTSDRNVTAASSTPQVPALPQTQLPALPPTQVPALQPPPVPSSMRGMRRLELRRGMEETHYLAQQRSQRTLVEPGPDMRLLDYVTEYDGNLMCPICRCPFVDPVILSDCDHCFCRECLSQVWTEYHPGGPRGSCPTCRAQSRLAAKGAVSKILVNLLDELVVRCPRHLEGCPSEIKRGEVKHHVERYCDWALVQCPSTECEQLIRRKDASQCLHWGVACIDCREHMFVSNLETHWQSSCPDRKVPCHLCNSQIDYRTINSHTTESCPALLRACPGESCGCSFRSTRPEVTHHAQSCVFASLAPIFSAQQKRIDQVEQEKNVQAREIQTLRRDVQTLKTLLDESRMPELDEPSNPAHPDQIPFVLEARVDRRRGRDELGDQAPFDITLDHDGRIDFPLHDHAVFPPAPPPPPARHLRSTAGLHDTDAPQSSAPFLGNTAYDANFDAGSFYSLEHDRGHAHLSSHSSDNDGRGSYASPVQHLLCLHESLRDEVTRLASALHDLDGRHSMLILNENLRLKEDMAFLNAQFSGLGRQVNWLTSARLQTHQQQSTQPNGRGQAETEADNDSNQSGAGSQRQAASGSMRDAATALRGAARMVNIGSGRDTLGFARRAGSDEGRTKL